MLLTGWLPTTWSSCSFYFLQTDSRAEERPLSCHGQLKNVAITSHQYNCTSNHCNIPPLFHSLLLSRILGVPSSSSLPVYDRVTQLLMRLYQHSASNVEIKIQSHTTLEIVSTSTVNQTL